MDEFLRDIHTEIFKRWILLHDDKPLITTLIEDHVIVIETKYSHSKIVFYPMNMIELSVRNKITDEIEFYLHFQLQTMKHALDLYTEMMNCIHGLIKEPKLRVLLSCTGGYTTTYFAMKVEKAVKQLHLNIEIAATSYNTLFEIGKEYDIILLAPQISYLQPKVQEVLKKQKVLKIPAQVFAKYDIGKLLLLLTDHSNKRLSSVDIESEPLLLSLDIKNHNKVLTLSIYRNDSRVYIAYRLYGKNLKRLLDNEIVKQSLSIQDIYDVLNIVLLQHPDIDIVGLSLPTTVREGNIMPIFMESMESNNMYQLLSSKYKQKFFVSNDANNAAVGYYATQKQYQSIAFLFQTVQGFAGCGIIVNGQLISGYQHLAGEVKYLPLNLSDDAEELSKTPEGTLELVSKTIVSIMSIISPNLIVLYSDLIMDEQELNTEIEELIPSEYIPPIIKVSGLKEYILIGLLIRSLQKYESLLKR